MDSQATEAINANQTRVATDIDESVAVEQLLILPLAEGQLHGRVTPAVQQQPLRSTPLLIPRAPPPTRKKRHKIVSATPISPLRQPVSFPVRDQTPFSETRENPFPDNSTFKHPAMSPPPPTLPCRTTFVHQHQNTLDTTTLKAMNTLLHLRVLGSSRRKELSSLHLASRQLHLILIL